MSNPSGTNGPSVPGYSSYRPPGAPWTAADALHDTGPIPRQSAVPGGGASGARRQAVDVSKVLGVVLAALGGLNFLWGFLPELTTTRSQDSLSVFAVGPAYVPVLLLIGGLLALAALLPGSEVSRLAVAAVSVGGAAGAIVSLGTQGAVQLVSSAQVSKGMGAILLVIFGIIQAVVAIGAYVVGADRLSWGRGGVGSAGRLAPAEAVPPGTQPPAGRGGAAGTGWPAGSSGGQGSEFAGGVQPGWYGTSPPWPSHDPRNAPADERPTGPQQVVVGAESRPEAPPVTPNEPPNDPSTGPAVDPAVRVNLGKVSGPGTHETSPGTTAAANTPSSQNPAAESRDEPGR